MTPFAKWYHLLLWKTQRVVSAAWTFRDSHYFVVEGNLYVMHTHGSINPPEWTWTLVKYL